MPAITVEQALQVALVQCQTGQLAEAEATCRKILTMHPDHLAAWLQLGEIYSRLGRLDESAAALERAVEIEPNRPGIHFNLGNTYAKSAAWDEAISCYHRALALKPGYEKAHTNLGYVLLEQNRPAEALTHFQQQSDGPTRRHNEGVAFSRSGRHAEALASFRQATALDPGYADAYWALTTELFLLGSYEEAWQILARHGARPERAAARLPFDTPKWDGAAMPSGTLLVYEEQGSGDAIQSLRYLPLLRKRLAGGRIILECPAPLTRLVGQNGGFGDVVVDRGSVFPRHDRHISSLDLPLLLGQCLPLPVAGPYLAANPPSRAAWRKKLGAGKSFRVGLAWAGDPVHRNDRLRSIPAELLLPLLRVPGATFHTLQIRPNDGRPQPLLQAGLIDLTDAITDLADTAALVAELDLVISVDTAVAHLAGALGKPIWTLLPFAPDWRWGLEREDTPWYPTMRLFRQPAPGDWDSVIDRVVKELRALCAAR